jgi:hypothetical protein
MVCSDNVLAKTRGYKTQAARTVALKLIPTVVVVTANGSLTTTKTAQSSAVKKVLPARASLLPSLGHSINHAPN